MRQQNQTPATTLNCANQIVFDDAIMKPIEKIEEKENRLIFRIKIFQRTPNNVSVGIRRAETHTNFSGTASQLDNQRFAPEFPIPVSLRSILAKYETPQQFPLYHIKRFFSI